MEEKKKEEEKKNREKRKFATCRRAAPETGRDRGSERPEEPGHTAGAPERGPRCGDRSLEIWSQSPRLDLGERPGRTDTLHIAVFSILLKSRIRGNCDFVAEGLLLNGEWENHRCGGSHHNTWVAALRP